MNFDLPAHPIDMTGPWQAVAADPMGYVLDPHDEDDDMAECDVITVVRRTALPIGDAEDVDAPDKLPANYRHTDILYRLEDLQDEPDRVPVLLAHAVAVAEAMNAKYPALMTSAREMPAGAIVASASRVWIKRNSADRYPPPHPGYEEWWTEATTYAVRISNREVDEMLALGTVDLLRPLPASPARGAPGTWRCNKVERCFCEDGHDGDHGFDTTNSGSYPSGVPDA